MPTCSLWCPLAVRPLPAALPWQSLGRHLGTFLFCRQLGTLLWCGAAKRVPSHIGYPWEDERLLAQDQLGEFVLGVHHVVGAGGFQLCAAAETPADARTLKAGVVAGQDIDIGIAYVERGRRVGA